MIKLLNNKLIIDESSISFHLDGNDLYIDEIDKNKAKELFNKAIIVNMMSLNEESQIIYLGSLDLSSLGFIKEGNKQILSYSKVFIKRIVKIGDYPTGKTNSILDLADTRNYSNKEGDYHTGLTVVKSCEDPFNHKHIASSYVYNGYGKSTGLMQIEEIGNIETNIVLTSTLNVGKMMDAVVEDVIEHNPGVESINPIVLECNDGSLSKSIDRICDKGTYHKCLNNPNSFKQGDNGAGSGMTCHGLKGGLGSSSRVIKFGDKEYTLALLLNTNFGSSNAEDLVFKGRRIGPLIKKDDPKYEDKGSCVGVLVTDIPFETRQLKRVLKRIELGLARTGSYAGHGSGDVFMGYTTMEIVKEPIYESKRFNDAYINIVFKNVVDMAEEAVLNSMLFSHPLDGYKKKVNSIMEYIDTFIDLIDEEIIIND